VLAKGEFKQLSFVGSHTLGCKFTHDPEILTPELEAAVKQNFKNTPGFNYGRLDLVADSLERFKAGQFTMVEANGIASLPTNIFDPDLSVWQSYKILFEHLQSLVQVAAEHKNQPHQKIGVSKFIKQSLKCKKAVENQQTLLEKIPNFYNL
jgi:hypothetical protein